MTEVMSARDQLAAEPDGHIGTSMHVIDNVRGLTYRMLDYWTRLGYVRTVSDPEPGSGRPRFYDPADYPMLRRAVLLMGAGLKAELAFKLARRDTSEIAPGIWVTFALDLVRNG